jgi:hypothetical protein
MPRSAHKFLASALTIAALLGPAVAEPAHPDHRQPTPSGLSASPSGNPDPAAAPPSDEQRQNPLERALDESANRDMRSICRGCDQ